MNKRKYCLPKIKIIAFEMKDKIACDGSGVEEDIDDSHHGGGHHGGGSGHSGGRFW